jgi:5'-methylthioadenosine phosphorylase
MEQVKTGVIGGSGLYEMEGLKNRKEVQVETPFGPPSDAFIIGVVEGKPVAFLARHGRGHRILPSELNFRANIYAMKKLGVERILSASAVGSLRQELAPLDIVLPDQFVDRTRGRISTFFGAGLVAHVGFAHPICPDLIERVHTAASAVGIKTVKGGTYLCMEGPAFSTKAESHLYRSWGMDIIGMTNLQEAKLAREAEICYVTIALVTDYDCWHESHDSVTVEMIISNLQQNSKNAQSIIRESVKNLPDTRACGCADALKHALITDRSLIPAETRQKLQPIVGRYLG